jgi:hypothetical protein
MTRNQKTDYLRIALGLQGIGINNEIADRIIETYEKILELKGKFSINHAVEIEWKMDMKYKEIEAKTRKNKTND